jgi:hypothetical protein
MIVLSTFAVLVLFQPFGEVRHNNQLTGIVRMGSYALLSGMVFFSFHFVTSALVRTRPELKQQYAVVFWASYYLLLLLGLTFSIFLLKNFWMDFQAFTLTDLWVVFGRVCGIGGVPAIILLAWFGGKPNLIERSQPRTGIVLKSMDKNPEYLNLHSEQVIAILSDGNYVEVIYHEEQHTRTKLMRNCLNNIEQELGMPFLRVHRGSIINLNNIESAKFNSQGGLIQMRFSDQQIRISRRYLSAFSRHWCDTKAA